MVDVGIEPTTQKPMVCRRRHLLRYFSGVLVRLTTCNWLTYSLPKLSLITVQQSHCSLIVHGVLLTHALALSVCKSICAQEKVPRIYTSTPSGGDLNSRNWDLYTPGSRIT